MAQPSRLFVLALILALPSPLLAHGGQASAPSSGTPKGSSGGGRMQGPGTPPKPGAPGNGAGLPAITGRRRPPITTGGVPTTGAGTGAGPLSRGGSGRRAATTTVGMSPASPLLEGWEPWWEQNKDRFLDLRGRLLTSHSVTGSPGMLAGRGRKSAGRTSRRADPGMIDGRIVPSLLSIIENSDDRDILDSAVLALARSAPIHRASEVLDATIPLLAHKEISVQSSAALSLGVLRSREAANLLLALARDDSTGRAAVGGGPVPRQVRAHAAFALGLVADARSVYRMLQLITRLPNGERDVRAGALSGLAMLPTDHSQLDVVQTVLIEMLSDRRLDPMVASYVPTTLAKLQRRSALPALLRSFDDPDADNQVRESIALALGRMATLQDAFAVQALVDEVRSGRDRLTRHFSLISLAQMGTRGEWSDAHAELALLLGHELAGDGKSQEHRSWAALAAAILGRAHPDAQPLLIDRLRLAYTDEHAPTYKGAFALALGLLHDIPSTEAILEDFHELSDPGFRSHAAVALGFLEAIETSDELRELCQDRSTPNVLRLASATALGLLGDSGAVPVLVQALKDTASLSVRAALANAIGLIGDRSAVEPLLEVAGDADLPALSRAFACVAVGLLAERSALPFNEPLKADGNYMVPVDAIQQLLAIL